MLSPTTHYTQTDDGNVPDEVTYSIGNAADPADVTITAWEVNDGGDDVNAWETNPIHVQIDMDEAARSTGIVVHLNDGPPIYQGNPEMHKSAVEVLRQVRNLLVNNPTIYAGRGPALDALNKLHGIVTRSGVIL